MLTTTHSRPTYFHAAVLYDASCGMPRYAAARRKPTWGGLRGTTSIGPLTPHAPTARAPRRTTASVTALALPPGLGRAVITPMLATGHMLLKDPNITIGLAAMLGAAAMEVARQQDKMVRVASVVLAAASPVAMRLATGALMVHLGIDAARVPVQVMLDTALAAIAGTSVALFSTLLRPPWAPEQPAAIEGPAGPLVARFVLAAAAGPVLFHTLMAASLPALLHHTVRILPYVVGPAFALAANA